MSAAATEWWLVRHAPAVNPGRAVYGALDLDVALPPPEVFAALSDMLPADPVWLATPLSRTRKTLDGILRARVGEVEVRRGAAFSDVVRD